MPTNTLENLRIVVEATERCPGIYTLKHLHDAVWQIYRDDHPSPVLIDMSYFWKDGSGHYDNARHIILNLTCY